MEKIVIGTSLAPCELEKQFICVRSWIENGFRVVSCNTGQEIEKLRGYFGNMDIEFVEVGRDAFSSAGKPLPYIQDILNIVSRKADSVCGYINSDILLSHMSDGMYEYIRQEAKDSFLFTRRNEINQIEDIEKMEWKIHFDGIDLFFMDKKLVDHFYDDGFFVQSVWDLCILIKCRMLGIRIKELMNPIAFHQRHPIKWNFALSDMLVKKFWEKYFERNENAYKCALDLYYRILFEDCRQVSFCTERNYRCLFVVEENDREVVERIRNQDYPAINIAYDAGMAEKYDFVFYIKRKILISEAFCRTAIFLMESYKCRRLELGSFFLSDIENNWQYNELNRDFNLIPEINEACSMNTLVERGNAAEMPKRIYIPVSNVKISIYDKRFIRVRKLCGSAYIMPAGIRGEQWYQAYQDKLKNINIIGYIDNSERKIGSTVMEKKVYPVEMIGKDARVIVASKYYSREIMRQLSETVSAERLFDAGRMLWIDDNGYVYYFELSLYKECRVREQIEEEKHGKNQCNYSCI